MKASPRKASRRVEAENPTTPPERLRILARKGRAKEVAANPNTPVDLLLQLAARHFDAFLANPVLPLLLLEDPGLFLKLPTGSLRRLLRNKDLPATFLQTLTRHPDAEVRGAAKLHVAAPSVADQKAELDAALHALPARSGSLPTLLRLDLLPLWLLEPLGGAISNELRREVLATLQRRPDEPSQALWRLLERGGLRPRTVNTWTGMAPNLTGEELERLARSGPVARWQAAQHPLTPPATLQRLTADASPRVALAALANRSTPEAALWAYAGSAELRCRLQVVRNPACPARLLDQLSQDRSAQVRALVARHRAADDSTLSRLAGDADKNVVLAVLANRRTGAASLEVLSHSPDVSIRRAVAAHRCTPLAVTERLMEDADAGVRKALAGHGNVTREMFIRLCCDANEAISFEARFRRKSWPSHYRWKIYNVPKAPDELAVLLREWTPRPPSIPGPPLPLKPWKPRRQFWRQHPTQEDYQRMSRTHSPEITEHELAELARDPVAEVREGVAQNARTPVEALRLLVADPSQRVRERLAFNASLPPDLLRQLGMDASLRVRQFTAFHKNCPPDLLEALALATEAEVRGSVAGNHGTPVETLRRLASDDACHRGLAQNPKTPGDVLAELWKTSEADHRTCLAINPSLPVPLMLEITLLPEDDLRAAVATNPSLPIAEAERLVKDAVPAVRRAVAGRADLSPDIFRRLAAETTPGMAKVLARNPQTPADILAGYARHPENEVRQSVVHNPSTPTSALLVLVEDPAMLTHLLHRPDKPPELEAKLYAKVPPGPNRIHAWLQNADTPLETFEKIIREGTKEELQALQYNERTPEPVLLILAQSSKRDHRWSLVFRQRMPPAIAMILARDPDPDVRCHLACRHRLPTEILFELLADEALPDYSRNRLRLSLAQRPDTSPDLLIHMAREQVTCLQSSVGARRPRTWRRRRQGNEEVLAALAGRTEVPVIEFEKALSCNCPEYQAALLQRPDLPSEWRTRIEGVALNEALQGSARLARLAALTHRRAPRQRLLFFAEQGNWLERYAVTQNPIVPEEILSLLLADANALVRDAAKTRLAEVQRSKS
jgi:hypothetical protein